MKESEKELVEVTPIVRNWINTANASNTLNALLLKRVTVIEGHLNNKPVESTDVAIASYEKSMKDARMELAELKSDRMQFTAVIDKIKELKMKPEKESEEKIKAYAKELTDRHKEKKERDDKKKQVDAEIVRVKEQVSNHVTQTVSGFRQQIAKAVSDAFEHALTNGVSEAELPGFLIERSKVFEGKFKMSMPVITSTLTPEEVKALAIETVKGMTLQKPSELEASYVEALEKQFEFYSISLKNKKDSLQLSSQELSEALNEISNDAQNQQVQNRLQATSTTSGGVEIKTKTLKTFYSIDMPDNEQTAMVIIAAFASNWSAAFAEVSVSSVMNLSIKQMGSALASLKNKDAMFAVYGVIFKKEEKI